MSHPHPHPHPEANGHVAAEVPAAQVRQPQLLTVIRQLNASLDDRANEVRQLQDRVVWHKAVQEDLELELAAARAALEQVSAENGELRRRLELPEVGHLPESAEPAE